MPQDLEARVRALLTTLKTSQALEMLAAALAADKAARTAALNVIERVLRVEVDSRREHRIARRLDDAKLPDRPTLETFDFDFQLGLGSTEGSFKTSPCSPGSTRKTTCS
jgi:IstB-like ATP binding protein